MTRSKSCPVSASVSALFVLVGCFGGPADVAYTPSLTSFPLPLEHGPADSPLARAIETSYVDSQVGQGGTVAFDAVPPPTYSASDVLSASAEYRAGLADGAASPAEAQDHREAAVRLRSAAVSAREAELAGQRATAATTLGLSVIGALQSVGAAAEAGYIESLDETARRVAAELNAIGSDAPLGTVLYVRYIVEMEQPEDTWGFGGGAYRVDHRLSVVVTLVRDDGQVIESAHGLTRTAIVGRDRDRVLPSDFEPIAPSEDIPRQTGAPFDQLRFLTRVAISDLRTALLAGLVTPTGG